MSKSLLDLMPKDEAQKALERGRKRLEKNRAKRGLDVSPEIFLVAEFGYYFGWEAVKDIRRGLIESKDIDGNEIRDIFTLDEALLLLEGARKVWYTKLMEQGHANLAANVAARNEYPGKAFNDGVKPFTERAAVTE